MGIEWQLKPFKALSITELHQLFLLRSEVFVLEQNCVYQDIDGNDPIALHVTGTFDGQIVAYCRIFKSGDYFETASIGRVVVRKIFRDRKWGFDMMREAIAGVEMYFGETLITISAQLYLKKFYESLGFIAVGETYLEDDIVHIKMIKSN